MSVKCTRRVKGNWNCGTSLTVWFWGWSFPLKRAGSLPAKCDTRTPEPSLRKNLQHLGSREIGRSTVIVLNTLPMASGDRKPPGSLWWTAGWGRWAQCATLALPFSTSKCPVSCGAHTLSSQSDLCCPRGSRGLDWNCCPASRWWEQVTPRAQGSMYEWTSSYCPCLLVNCFNFLEKTVWLWYNSHLKYTIHWVSLDTELWHHYHNHYKNIFMTSRRNPVTFSSTTLILHSFKLWATTNAYFVPTDFPTLDISCIINGVI